MTAKRKTKTTEELKALLAQTLGESEGNLKALTPKWLTLMEKGVIVTLHISRWRARSKLTYQDLGLPEPETPDETKALEDLLVLGRKNLLPLEFIRKFDAIDSGARKLLADRAFEVSHYGLFVTAKAYQPLKTRLEEFRNDYFTNLEAMLNNWNDVCDQLADEYRAQARTAYRRMDRLAPHLVPESEAEFVGTFVIRILDLLPTPEQIRQSFGFTWDVFFVPLPSTLERDRAEQEKLQLGVQQMRFEQEQTFQKARVQNELEREQARLESQRMWQQEQAEREMREEVIEKAKADKEALVNTFLKELVVQLRELVYEASTDVLNSIQKHQRLHPRSVVQLQNLIEQVDQLNFFDDREVTAMLNQVRQNLGPGAEGRDVNSIKRTLESVATVTRSSLMEFGEQPRSGRSVGVADVPTLEVVRQARASLGISVPEIETTPVMRQARLEVPVQ